MTRMMILRLKAIVVHDCADYGVCIKKVSGVVSFGRDDREYKRRRNIHCMRAISRGGGRLGV